MIKVSIPEVEAVTITGRECNLLYSTPTRA